MPAPNYALLRGTAERGKIEWDTGEALRWAKILGNLEGRRIEITIRRERKVKSAKQRGYYWAVIVPMIAEDVGEFGRNGLQRVHDGLRYLFLTVTDPRTGMTRVRSTEELDTVETEQYHEQCRIWANTDRHIWIGLPNEYEIGDL